MCVESLFYMSEQRPDTPEVVGIVPMAGLAKRLGELKCSKEIYPVWTDWRGAEGSEPGAVCECLLNAMRYASVRRVYVILREGKWDIPAHLGSGAAIDMDIAYLMMQLPYGTSYSADQAYPFVRNNLVAFGFPDMIFTPEDVFLKLREQQQRTKADIVLGTFPADRPEKVDMVRLAGDGRVEEILIKPEQTDLQDTWGIALWTPRFTAFMHAFLRDHLERAVDDPELYVGDVVRAARDRGLDVHGMRVSDQPFVDIGTWEDLQKVGADR